MFATVKPQLSAFALDVAEGLSLKQKRIAPHHFYDDLGSSLFEAITLLPEYGLARADERLLRRHAPDIAAETGPISIVAELGSGTGKKTKHVLDALLYPSPGLTYRPIDVSQTALEMCQEVLGKWCSVEAIRSDWLQGLAEVDRTRFDAGRLLVLFLGSSIGNLERTCISEFLRNVRFHLRDGDFFLLGADLVKDIQVMLSAYDDSTGVTAAFNLNLLGRINRELDADFDLRSFAHEVRWGESERRIEMHLLSLRNQSARSRALEATFDFQIGETIWTESSHKFTKDELADYARSSGFETMATWTDAEWPFVETLWRAA